MAPLKGTASQINETNEANEAISTKIGNNTVTRGGNCPDKYQHFDLSGWHSGKATALYSQGRRFDSGLRSIFQKYIPPFPLYRSVSSDEITRTIRTALNLWNRFSLKKCKTINPNEKRNTIISHTGRLSTINRYTNTAILILKPLRN